MAGVDGNGQRELAEAIYGLTPIESGNIFLNGFELTEITPDKTHQNKISMIPEDRHKTGLILDYSQEENFILHDRRQRPFSKKGLLQFKAIKEHAKNLIARFDIRPTDETQLAQNLSGGNQQKIILAREIEHTPELLIAVQPTRGLDVGAIEVVHKELLKLKAQGKTVLLISFELDEILALSDRIGIIFNGNISKTLTGPDFDRNLIGLYMTGQMKT